MIAGKVTKVQGDEHEKRQWYHRSIVKYKQWHAVSSTHTLHIGCVTMIKATV